MSNRRFKLSNIIPTGFWLSRKSANTKPHDISKEKPVSEKASPIQTFDEMILLSSSSRSFKSERRIPLCSETEHVLPHLTLSQPCLGSGKSRKEISERRLSVTTVVKSSVNAESDFKESMIEMIVENNITDFEGLEELLVSYLMLNSDEFHEVIVSVFKELVIGLFRKPKNV